MRESSQNILKKAGDMSLGGGGRCASALPPRQEHAPLETEHRACRALRLAAQDLNSAFAALAPVGPSSSAATRATARSRRTAER